MILGRVIGNVVATIKSPSLTGQRMLLIQPLKPDLEPTGKPVICLDATGAGAGEVIYYCRGKESSFPFLPAEVVTDMTVVGIVDTIHLQKGPLC